MIRIFVCDDSDWFAALVAAWAEQHDDLVVVGSAHDRGPALSELAAARPDVVLLDTMTYGLEPLSVAEVRATVPGVRVLLCSGYHAAFVSARVGVADGYVAKDDGEARLIAAIRDVAAKA